MKKRRLVFSIVLIILCCTACGPRPAAPAAAMEVATEAAPTEAAPTEAAPTETQASEVVGEVSTDSFIENNMISDTISTEASVVPTSSQKIESYHISNDTYNKNTLGYDFSCDRAWVRYYEEYQNGTVGDLYYGVINSDGDLIITATQEDWKSWLGLPKDHDEDFYGVGTTAFCNGVSCVYLYSQWCYSEPSFAFIDADGNILYKSESTETEKYYLLGNSEEEFLVCKIVKSFSDNYATIYTIDKYGNLLCDETQYDYDSEYHAHKRYAYLGNGLFSGYGGMYDIASHSFVDASLHPYAWWPESGRKRIMEYEAGIRYYGRDYGNCYKDENENIILYQDDIKLNTDKYICMGEFSGEYAAISVRGQDGKSYVTVIDKEGNCLYEPVKVKYFDGYSYGGYAFVGCDDSHACDSIVSPTGEVLSIRDGLKRIGNARVYPLNEDFNYNFLSCDGYIQFDSTAYAKSAEYYRIEDGKIIDEVNLLSSTKSIFDTKVNDSVAEENQSDFNKQYSSISNFMIEGKWKSVGTDGFGQAQPGAIVIFDGNNCNFFSPKDTYAISKDGDNYRLDCTAFMSTSNVSLIIKTIDKNNIDVYYGDNVTELTRVD